MKSLHKVTLILFCLIISLINCFTPGDLTTLGYILTDKCRTECIDYFSSATSFYCKNGGSAYCCSTTISTPFCSTSTVGNVCTTQITTSDLKFSLCGYRDDIRCGSS